MTIVHHSTSHANMQKMADENNIDVIRIYGIAGHGKGEVDHVGGIAKTSIRREVANGSFFYGATDMVDFLDNKFSNKFTSILYSINEVDIQELEVTRLIEKLNVSSSLVRLSSKSLFLNPIVI